jgi:hypothetical protein
MKPKHPADDARQHARAWRVVPYDPACKEHPCRSGYRFCQHVAGVEFFAFPDARLLISVLDRRKYIVS